MTLAKVLRHRHVRFDPDHLAMISALCDGGKSWRAVITRVLPKNAAEPADVWRDRKTQAAYFNHMGGLISILVGHLFSEPTEMAGGGNYWEALAEDADHHGTDWDEWWAKAFLDALKNRQSFAWVNVPARVLAEDAEPAANLAEQEAQGELDAHLVLLSGEHVIDWSEDAAGNLQWVMVEHQDWIRDGPDKPPRVVWKWTSYDATAIRRWEWSDPAGSLITPPANAEARELPEVLHGYGVLPVVRLQLPTGLWMGDKLHDPALHLCRRENDLDWALYKAAHALLYIKSEWGDEGAPVIGPGYYMELGKDDEVGYAEPSGRNFEILRQRVKDIRQELYRVVQAMAQGLDNSASQQAQSGDSKGMDWKASEILLSAYAGKILDTMTKTALVVKAIRSTDEPPTFSGLHTGEDEGTDTFLERAALAIDARAMSPLFRRVVAKREVQRILGDEATPEEIQEILAEIDASEVDPLGAPFQPTPVDDPEDDDDDDPEG